MPKETVASHGRIERPYRDPSGTIGGTVEVALAVEVRWDNHGGEVQVGILGWPVNPPEGLDLEAVDLPTIYAGLGWKDLNRLINRLRHARDAVFGKPE